MPDDWALGRDQVNYLRKFSDTEVNYGKYQTIFRNKMILKAISVGDRILRLFQKLLYPPRCVCCDVLLGGLEDGCCPECAANLPRILGPVCMKCGKPVGSDEEEYCEDCRQYRHTFDRGIAVFTYTGSLRQSVYRMKRQNRRDYLPFYAKEMVHTLQPVLSGWRPEVLMPIPMHRRKKRRRGYNQAELLAEEISRLTGIPVLKDALYCTRLNSDQKMLGRKERRKNLKGSFAGSEEQLKQFTRILIVDDVYTTGSTMDEAADVLKQAGIKQIFFAVLCTGKGKRQYAQEKSCDIINFK